MKKFLPLILTNITTIILLIFVFFLYSFTHAYTTFTKEEPVAVLSFSKIEKNEYPSISFEKAQTKVKKAVNNISATSGTPLDEVINDIVNNK